MSRSSAPRTSLRDATSPLVGAVRQTQLKNNLIPGAFDSYLNSENPTDFSEVIQAAERVDHLVDITRYLIRARTKTKVRSVMARWSTGMQTNKLPELKEFMGGTNTANLQAIGDRLCEEQTYKAAKVLYGSSSNNAKLASCHVHIGDFSQAVEAARKANNGEA